MAAAALALVVVTGNWLLGVVFVSGCAAVPFLVTVPWLAALTLVVVDFADVSGVLADRVGFSAYIACLGLAFVALLVGLRTGRVRLVWSPVFGLVAVWFAAQGLAAFAAQDLPVAVAALVDTAKDLAFFFVVVTLLAGSTRVLTAVRVAVAVAVLFAVLTLLQEFVFHNSTTFFGFVHAPQSEDVGGATARHAGPETDPNFWGRTLVLFVPLALSLWAGGTRTRWRWAWVGAAVLLCGGLYLTGSRGALIGLGLALVVWFLVAGRPYSRWALGLPLLAVAFLLLPGAGSRLATLGELDAASGEGGDASLVGRVAAQKAGVAMFLDHPALGVGTANFLARQPEYQRVTGFVSTRLLAPHNLYLQMAAEGGILGLTAWTLFFCGSFFVALRGLVLVRRRDGPRSALGYVSVGVLAGLVGFAAASVFLHLAYLRVLLFVIGVGALVDLDARGHVESREPSVTSPSPSPGEPAAPLAAVGA